MDKPVNTSVFLKYALCLILLAAPLVRGIYGELYFLPFFIILALLFILSLFEQLKSREDGLFNHPLDWAMMALLIAYLLSLLSAVNIRSALLNVMSLSIYIMVFWICSRVARQDKGLKCLLFTCYSAGIIMAVFGMLVYCGIIHYYKFLPGGRIAGTLEYPNTFGIYMAALFMIGWSIILANRNRLIRAVVAGGNFLLITAMLGTLSRGTWILFPFAVLLFVFLVKQGKRLFAFGSGGASFVIGLATSQFFLNPTLGSRAIIYVVVGFIITVGAQIGLEFAYDNLQKNVSLAQHHTLWKVAAAVILVLIGAGILFKLAGNTYLTKVTTSRLMNITLQDEAVQQRLAFNRIAFGIIKDYPVTGAGGGGWEALYHSYASHQYWSTKTHNYFLQTWVETGTLGFVALLGVWAAFLYLLWKYRYSDKNSEDISIMIWGGTVAVFMLGAHSIIDFDMSIPAVAILLYGLIGTVKGYILAAPAASGGAIRDLPKKKQKKKGKQSTLKRKVLIGVLLGTGYSFVLIIGASFLWYADINFAQAHEVMHQNPNQAISLLNKSLSADPLNASNWTWAAILMADEYSQNHDSQAYNYALNFSQKALKLEPYNLEVMNSINKTFLQLGENDRAVSVARSMIRISPLQTDVYECLAHDQVIAGMQSMENGELDKANNYWRDSLKVKDMLPSQAEDPAVGLYFTSGQAELLLGNKEQGEKLLRTTLSLKGTNSKGNFSEGRKEQVDYFHTQSISWLIASLELSGNDADTDTLLNQISPSEQKNIKNQVEQIKPWLSKARSLNSKP